MHQVIYEEVLRVLRSLLDGTQPLPLPYPQKLISTKDDEAICRLEARRCSRD